METLAYLSKQKLRGERARQLIQNKGGKWGPERESEF